MAEPLPRIAPPSSAPARIYHLTRLHLDMPSMQRNQRGALTQFDGGEPITVRAARYVGDILKYVPDDQAIAPRYSFHM